MNLALQGIEANLGSENADAFTRDLHPDHKADFILANPPLNDSDWGHERLKDDVRWRYGVPPAGNANFAWVQHIVHHLTPRGVADLVLANGSTAPHYQCPRVQRRGLGDLVGGSLRRIEISKNSTRHGLSSWSRQMRATESLTILKRLAIERVVHCVEPSSGSSCRVSWITASTVPGGSHDLRPRPSAILPTPSTPLSAKRFRQALTASEST
jgi:hypothetical protein